MIAGFPKFSVFQTGFLSQLIIFSIAHTFDIVPEGLSPIPELKIQFL